MFNIFENFESKIAEDDLRVFNSTTLLNQNRLFLLSVLVIVHLS